ncbi:DNA replication factor C, large subunit [Rhizoctonia solani AG-3 Rhs1AP]|uniref:Replication factor C subunit 1 n=1 Tax=Rhizoctonia solani AG-3 Rhs1AP TaxID=1086054 RepID=X8JS49_9AGAM|nr:DNA replication factor C, large subunit [Rhizoctonia solani AG-3 Rhs1AP]
MAQYPSPLTEPDNELPSSQASTTLDGYPRVFKDPVHDYVELPATLSCIVDTPQFQRLRELKQLGSAYYVFPGAAHNRFEHCLGEFTFSRRMVEGLRNRQPELGIDDRDVKCVITAGLCHDLGHGPFSHVWDNKFIPAVSPGTKWTHEMGSEMMFDAICADYDVNLSMDEQNFIKDLIRGRPKLSIGRVPQEKPFLFEIVANNRNGIDVDKFDYIQRDTHAVGNKMNDVTSRLIRSARVINNEICYADKDWYMVSQLFESRFALHKMIYNHKSCKSIELMIIDALVLADPFMQLADKIHNAEEYLYLNDSVLLDIERSKAPELEKSREIIHRIRTRQLYKEVDMYMFAVEHRDTLKQLTPEKAAEVVKTIEMPEGADADLAAEDVAIDMTLIHLGMKDKRPVDLVKFYGKRNPNGKAAPENASHVFSQSSQELCLRIFTRNPDKFGIVQTACREVLKQLFSSERDGSLEAPSTPKMSPAKSLEGCPNSAARDDSRKSSQGRSVSTPFAHNPFTTVPPNYRETGSPQFQGALNGKRNRGGSGLDELAMASKDASHSNLRGFFGPQNGAKPAKKKTQILISDDEDDEPPTKSPSKPVSKPAPLNTSEPSRSPSPVRNRSIAKRKSKVLMSSDEEDNVRAAFKKAALSVPSKELDSVSETSSGQAKPLAGMAVVFTGDFEWERERLVDATTKNGGEVLKQPGSTMSFIVIGKNISQSKLQAIEKKKLKTKTEKEFMELIKPKPVRVVEKPTPVAKSPPKKTVASRNRKSSPAEEDDEDLAPKPALKTKKAAPVKKRASSPAATDDDVPAKPAAKKGGWNRPTGDNKFDEAMAAAKAAKASGPIALGSKEVPNGHPNALAGLTFVFTGELSSFSREEAQDLAKRFGGRVTGQASGKTSYVVVGEGAGPGKMKKVASLGVKTLDEDGFLNLIGTREGKLDAKAQEKQKQEEEKIKQAARDMERREREAAKDAKKAQDAGNTRPAPPPPTAQLWTTKYAPQNLKEICGNKALVDKLQLWLHEWQASAKAGFKKPGKNGMNTSRAVLLAGPPGIGKTTSAHLVAKAEGYTPIELNASDTRSKKLIEVSASTLSIRDMAEIAVKNSANINNTSLDGWMAGQDSSNVAGIEITDRTVLIMDEVDGMSAGDRGGVSALITLIKKTKVPIICIANDDKTPKLKSLVHSAFRLSFRKPEPQTVRSRILTIAFKEKMKVPANVIDQLIAGTQSDIRQVLNMLSTWKLSHNTMDFDEGKELVRLNEKYSIKSPFEVTNQILGPYTFSATSRHTLNDKIEMYFHDHSFVPLFIQENYLKTQPAKTSKLSGKDAILEQLRLMDRAASSISDGDLVDAMIHGTQQHWSLMPLHAVTSTVRPSSYLYGTGLGYGGPLAMSFPQYVAVLSKYTPSAHFTRWLGQNSKQGKLQRQLGDIQIRMRLKVSGNKAEIRQSYIPALLPRLVRPLIDEGTNGVPSVIEIMDEYYLSKDEWDAMLELGIGPNKPEELASKISTATKTAFTRKYNSTDHPIAFHKPQEFGRPSTKIAAESAPDHEDVLEVDDEPEEEEEKQPKGKGKASEIEKDKLIKESKPKGAKGAAKGRKSTKD